MVPPASVRKLALAVLLLAAGFGLAGRLAPTDAVGIVAFAGGAVVASSPERVEVVARPPAVAPVLVVLTVLLLGLGFTGFGNAASLLVLAVCAGLAGAVVASV